jgi:hypothetical protein
MATQKIVAEVIPFPSSETQLLIHEIPNIKVALLEKLRLLIQRYACPKCSAKKLANTGAGLLCADCFGRTRRDIRKIVAYLAARA